LITGGRVQEIRASDSVKVDNQEFEIKAMEIWANNLTPQDFFMSEPP
jgi:hypothetical protein